MMESRGRGCSKVLPRVCGSTHVTATRDRLISPMRVDASVGSVLLLRYGSVGTVCDPVVSPAESAAGVC
jgi:hypothetical protein